MVVYDKLERRMKFDPCVDGCLFVCYRKRVLEIL